MASTAKKLTETLAVAVPAEVLVAPLEQKRIERLAYAYWEARGRPLGSPEEDWFRAEEELRHRKKAFTIVKERRRRAPRKARISSQSPKSTE